MSIYQTYILQSLVKIILSTWILTSQVTSISEKKISCLIVVQFSKISLIIMTDCKNFDCITERCIPNKTQIFFSILFKMLSQRSYKIWSNDCKMTSNYFFFKLINIMISPFTTSINSWWKRLSPSTYIVHVAVRINWDIKGVFPNIWNCNYRSYSSSYW